jgi:putative transposase
MNRTTPYPIILSKKEINEFHKVQKQKSIDRRFYERMKAIIYISEGKTEKTVAELLNKTIRWVIKWRKRFFNKRIDGLYDLSRPGRPPIFSP